LYGKASEVLEDYLNNISNNAHIRLRLSHAYLCQGKYDIALIEVDRAFSLDPNLFFNLLARGDIYHLRKELIKAEEEYNKLLEAKEQIAHLWGRKMLGALYLLQGRFEKVESEAKHGIELSNKLGDKWWQADFHFQLAYTYLRAGNPNEALEECNKGFNYTDEGAVLQWQRYTLHIKELIYLEMHLMGDAQRTARELKQVIENGLNKKAMRYYYYMVGQIEFERNNYSKAIEYFTTAISLLPYQRLPYESYNDHALFINPLASSYYKKGDMEKAREEYEKITMLTTGRLFYGDIYARSFYMLGKIYQQKGWEGKAINHYEKFLNLWKDADPGIPEVDDAKKQSTILKTK